MWARPGYTSNRLSSEPCGWRVFPFHAIGEVDGFAVWPASRWWLSAGDALTSAHGGDEGVARGAAEQRLNRLLALIVEAAAEAVGFDGGTVTVRCGDDVGTVASTDPDLLTLDGAQYTTGDGPCLDALEQDEAVTWTAADDDQRWRAFQEAAEELGIATSLSVPLPIDETMEIAASLNLYGHQQEQITTEQLNVAMQFAFQLATALHTIGTTKSTAGIARRAAQAIRSRAVIEQAKGVLMAGGGISPAAAAALLAELADAGNTTLHDAATRLVHERAAGDQPPPA